MSLVFVCGHNGPCSPYCICKHVQGSMCMHGMGACPCMWGIFFLYVGACPCICGCVLVCVCGNVLVCVVILA